MKEKDGDKKKEWQKPAYESLKFSLTLGGNKPQWIESVSNGPNHGASMTTIS